MKYSLRVLESIILQGLWKHRPTIGCMVYMVRGFVVQVKQEIEDSLKIIAKINSCSNRLADCSIREYR